MTREEKRRMYAYVYRGIPIFESTVIIPYNPLDDHAVEGKLRLIDELPQLPAPEECDE